MNGVGVNGPNRAEGSAVIQDPTGLHARPAVKLTKLAKTFAALNSMGVPNLFGWEPLPEQLAPHEEMLMMGLRLAEGVPRSRLQSLFGSDWTSVMDKRGLRQVVECGWLSIGESHLRATDQGRRLLDALLVKILAA